MTTTSQANTSSRTNPLTPGGASGHELPTLPALVDGTVTHHRRGRVRHGFRYGLYQWLVDLDAIPEQPWYLRAFASFRASDHLGDPAASIKENLEYFLGANGITLPDSPRIIMLANARVLGHVFDPLSVFWCFDSCRELVAIVAEVHNTYGQRHAYLLRPDARGVARTDKAFHVSPFYDVSGSYELTFELSPEVVSATIILSRGETVAFCATFRGSPQPATRACLARQLITKPLMTQKVSVLIRVHGIVLWLRRLPVRRPPRHQPQKGVS